MTIEKLYLDINLITDSTRIVIIDRRFRTEGRWFEDNILEYKNREIYSFTWQNNNTVFINF